MVFSKIKSRYIFQILFSFIKDEDFALKLFRYSKLFQNKMKYKLSSYICGYIDKNLKIQISKYFEFNSINTFGENIDILSKNLEEDFKLYSNLNLKIMKKYVKYALNNCHESWMSIDIFSPFFNYLSQKNLLYKLFVVISPNIIEKFHLKKQYIETFNKVHSKVSSLKFYFRNIDDINYLNEFNIDFNIIDRLSIIKDNDYYIRQYNNFFELILSMNNICSRLTYLNINICEFDQKINHNTNSFTCINNCKSLIELELTGIKFNSVFILDLNNLKSLNISLCSNILFTKELCSNLKSLSLTQTILAPPQQPYKFPELKECRLDDISDAYRYLFNYQSLTKLKKFIGTVPDYKILENSPLEILFLRSCSDSSYEIEKKMLVDVLSNRTVKNLYFELEYLTAEDIANIYGINPNVEKLGINYCLKNKVIVYNLYNKFPYINELVISDYWFQSYLDDIFSLEKRKQKIYNNQFENLIFINFNLFKSIKSYSFPIFYEHCNIMFSSLIKFQYHGEMDFDILKNLYYNLNKMPCLKSLILTIQCKDFDTYLFKRFKKKVLSLKLNEISLNFNWKFFLNLNKKIGDEEIEIKYTDNTLFKSRIIKIIKIVIIFLLIKKLVNN